MPPAGPGHFKKPTREDLVNRFSHHPPRGDQGKRYGAVRAAIMVAAIKLVELTPCTPEQSRALNALDEAMFLANAAIARGEMSVEEPRNCPPVTSRSRVMIGRGQFLGCEGRILREPLPDSVPRRTWWVGVETLEDGTPVTFAPMMYLEEDLLAVGEEPHEIDAGSWMMARAQGSGLMRPVSEKPEAGDMDLPNATGEIPLEPSATDVVKLSGLHCCAKCGSTWDAPVEACPTCTPSASAGGGTPAGEGVPA